MTRAWLAVLVAGALTAVALSGCDAGQRRREPSEKDAPRVAAIGDTSGLGAELQRAFDPSGFDPMPEPGPTDWLAQHPDLPQSYEAFLRADRNIPDAQRRVIYLLPIGGFPATAPRLAEVADVVHAFFALDVRILPAANPADVNVTTRVSDITNKRQMLAPEVLGWLRQRLPDDAFALMAVTMEDLYPEPGWNFVFGLSSLKERVGVQSFARQDPAFLGEKRPVDWQVVARRRATWTLLHEIAHTFGLTHCTYWHCVVAGSNSQEESDRSPLHACPVCLRKLHSAVRFDPATREEALAAAFTSLGIDDDAAWSAARAAWVRRGVSAGR